jgi:hypothetical protein
MTAKFSIDQSQIYKMSFSELTGSIFIRSQVIEQLMRQLLENHNGYRVANNFSRKTFGQLLIDFSQIYPDIKTPQTDGYPDMTLHSSFEIARDIRNDAAHGYYLIGLGVAEMLDEYGSKIEIDRYNLRTLQKSLMSIDQCIFEFIEYIQTNNLSIDLERPSAIEE